VASVLTGLGPIVTSLFVLLAGITIAGKHQFGIGGGALERLAQYPESLWLILFGFYISRNHQRNGVIGRHFKLSGERPPKNATIRWAGRESANSVRTGNSPQLQPQPAGE
jgi:hypothetical protein